MRTVAEVMNQIWDYALPETGIEYQILKRWAEEIVDECANQVYEPSEVDTDMYTAKIDQDAVRKVKQQL